MKADIQKFVLSFNGQIMIWGNILHLVLGQVYFGSYDWISMWTAAEHIANGGSFYDQHELIPGFVHQGIYYKGFPSQMPLFIYFLGLMAFTQSQGIARVAMWSIFLMLSILIYQLTKIRSQHVILLLFFFNPFFLFISFTGRFDFFPMFISVAMIYQLNRGNYIGSGVLLGLGLLIKVYPLYLGYLVGLIFIRFQKWRQLVKFVTGAIITIVPPIVFLWSRYGNLFYQRSLSYQFFRFESQFMLWFYIIPSDKIAQFKQWQLIFWVIFPIVLAISRQEFPSPENWYSLSVTLLAIFVISLSVLFPHYFGWWMIFCYPVISNYLDQLPQPRPWSTFSIFSAVIILLQLIGLYLGYPPFFESLEEPIPLFLSAVGFVIHLIVALLAAVDAYDLGKAETKYNSHQFFNISD